MTGIAEDEIDRKLSGALRLTRPLASMERFNSSTDEIDRKLRGALRLWKHHRTLNVDKLVFIGIDGKLEGALRSYRNGVGDFGRHFLTG